MEHTCMQPGRIGTMELRNRIIYPAMVANYCDGEGQVTDRLIAYLAERARGGAGLIITECALITLEGRSFFQQLSIAHDRFLPGLCKFTAAIHAEGAKAAIQLYHPGRQTTARICGGQPMAPSKASYGGETARAMTHEDIENVVRAFGDAALRAKEAGFDALELHAGNGYLLQQFLSHFTNHRCDRYGGSLGNRLRLIKEVIREVRRRIGETFPVLLRFCAGEPVEEGVSLYESVCAAKLLAKEAIDAIHVTAGLREGGHWVTPPACLPQGLHFERAHAIREAVSGRIPVIAIGRVKSLEVADQALAAGQADFITMGRAQLADPHLIAKAAGGRAGEIRPCIGCNEGCIARLASGKDISCAINPLVGREYQHLPNRKATADRVVVIGAGPAGCVAACASKIRGHQVRLLEATSQVGGRLLTAALPPFKRELLDYVRYLDAEVRRCGVELCLGHTASADEVAALEPDQVIVAVGAQPFIPLIKGLDTCPTMLAENALCADPANLPEHVIIIGGGMVGAETAEKLAAAGKTVTIVEMLGEIAADIEPRSRALLLERLAQLGVAVKTNATAVYATANELGLKIDNASHCVLPVSGLVVIASGYRADHQFSAELRARGLSVHEIGDARRASTIMNAVHDGFEIGCAI